MIPILVLAGLAFALSQQKRAASSSTRDDSTPEDSTGEPSSSSSSIEDQSFDDEPYTAELGGAVGAPYYYGRGSPSTTLQQLVTDGADCSGAVQVALVQLGLLDASATDRSATQLANDSDPIEVGQQQPGDLAFYNGHVMLVYSYPRSDGHSAVWGMHGGGQNTLGDDPTARLDVLSSALYWPDAFLTYGRLRA